MDLELSNQNKRIITLATIVMIIATIAIVTQFMVFYRLGSASSTQVFIITSTAVMQMSALLVLVLQKTKNTLAVVQDLAYADELTGLINRRKFNEILQETLQSNKENNATSAVLILDLDRFKSINDCHGHDAGDKIICQFGERIKRASGKNAITSRLSGDEFAVLVKNSPSNADLTSICENVLEEMKQPFTYEGKKIQASVSIGAAIIENLNNVSMNALRMADFALLNAKENGRNQYSLFNKTMADKINRRKHLEAGLNDAITNKILDLKYQPFVLQEDGTISGVEALIRWDDPFIGEIYPDEFIPVAHELGLIEKMGEFILERACSDIKPLDGLKLAVNISDAQFTHNGFVEQVKHVLVKTEFEADRLELEIGQNLLTSTSDKIKKDLKELRKLGVRLVLDDFGTSYSSMFFLRDFKLDRIKLDRNFVSNMQYEKDGAEVIQNMINLGSSFSDRLTVEGVETQAQHDSLRTSGVNELQGFHFSKPLALNELKASTMMKDHLEQQKLARAHSNITKLPLNYIA